MSATPTLLTEARPRVQEMSTDRSARAGVIERRGFDWGILTRIAAPVVATVTALTMISRSSVLMAPVIFIAAFVVLDIVALSLGHDSRDGLDWRRRHVDRLAPHHR